MLSILGLMHFITYKVLTSLFETSTTLRGILQLSVILSISFISSSYLVRNNNNLFTRFYYRLSSVWTGYLFYLFLASGLYGLILGLNEILSLLPSVNFIGRILLLLGIVFPTYALWKAHHLVVTEKTISIKNLPEIWKGRRAVFVSDIHLGQVHGEKFARKVVAKINHLKPDIIFNTGDLFDGVMVEAEKIIESFGKTQPKLGTYFVLGNHEEYGDTEGYLKAIEKIGMIVINNKMIEVDGVQIVGADYKTTRTKDSLDKILKDLSIDKNKPAILLKHVPDHLVVASENNISLHLSGHTHKAQVYPLNFITHRLFKGYDYGLNLLDEMQVLTTSGVGTWGPPLRFGSQSEIVLINFK